MGVQHCEPRRQVIVPDDDSTDVFFVVSDWVRATLYSKTGKEVSFQDLGAGEMFGALGDSGLI